MRFDLLGDQMFYSTYNFTDAEIKLYLYDGNSTTTLVEP